ncbi:MAG: DUF2179 domain-containing protein [Oscillospiraceae bacterium]|nr:DUF2179 domain-containing protein [Oscillospiraceae bacterium]
MNRKARCTAGFPAAGALFDASIVRGVTSWVGCGEYTNQETKVLYIILSKYEVPTLKAMIRGIGPHAFVVIKEGVKTEGNYLRKIP